MTSELENERRLQGEYGFGGLLFSNLPTLVGGLLERLLGLAAISRVYRHASGGEGLQDFIAATLAQLRIQIECEPRERDRIPSSGPVLVVANHPFGGLDALALAALLLSVRCDPRIMTNHLLRAVTELDRLCIFVDPFGGRTAPMRNFSALRSALDWLNDGHLLAVFPAGEVSHWQLHRRRVSDPSWSPMVAALAGKAEAAVVPVAFEGSNGPLFQLCGLIHPLLRTALLPHELVNKTGKTVRLRIGRPIPWARLARLESDQARTDYLRWRTYLLLTQCRNRILPLPRRSAATAACPVAQPIVGVTARNHLAADIAALEPRQTLLISGSYQVLVAEARQLPNVLPEIGRLRELSFRMVGEGTGRTIDLDRFDQHYLHLFVWQRESKEIVGAYRIGRTDLILRRFGLPGLYTSSLFKFHPSLFRIVTPALELGRSFVRAEYQKSYSPLLLLWKGIGRYVARYPHYRYLFGPVSITHDYQDFSRWLIMTYLQNCQTLPTLSQHVRGRVPIRWRPPRGWNNKNCAGLLSDLEEVSALIADIESERDGVPILLKQYLRLGGKALGFNLDRHFAEALDVLLLVDLVQVRPPVLGRYLGESGLQRFRLEHRLAPITPLAACA